MRFCKGHGTENDFIVLPDYEGEVDPSLVRALCDRRAGIGADGVLRVVPRTGHFFMDYYNADGSVAETCGNGIRVFARYLVAAELAAPGELAIDTRSGMHQVTVPADGSDITVDMGQAARLDDAEVSIGPTSWKASGWSLGNPHLVILDAGSVDSLDLTAPPVIDPEAAYPHGVNVEFVEAVGSGLLKMRVHERGVGETRSCGSGACAVAVAAMDTVGERSTYAVDVPGGRLVVRWRDDGEVMLTGPAVLVAAGEVDPGVIHSSRS